MNPQQAIRTPPNIGTDRIKDLIAGSYQRNTGAREAGAKYGLRLDDSLSNSEHKVWIDRKNRPTISFTGTRKIGDVGTDILLGLGLEKYSTRFRNSKKFMEDVRKKYSAPATIVSHSLGASLGEYAGGKNDKIINVDKGVGLSGIGKTIPKNQIEIRTSNDPVSLLSNTQKNLGKKIVIKDKKNFNLLDAHNFRYLDKLKNKII
jgi:hypothetical protein